jgi:hypothetical protein
MSPLMSPVLLWKLVTIVRSPSWAANGGAAVGSAGPPGTGAKQVGNVHWKSGIPSPLQSVIVQRGLFCFVATGTPFRDAVVASSFVGSKETAPFTKQTRPLPLSLLPLQSAFQVCGLAAHAVSTRFGISDVDLFWPPPDVRQSTAPGPSAWHICVWVLVKPQISAPHWWH